MSASKNTTSTPRSPIARPTPLPFQPQSSLIKAQQKNWQGLQIKIPARSSIAPGPH
jgi:hypothetical protein